MWVVGAEKNREDSRLIPSRIFLEAEIIKKR
jgi:hypothetical protein